ncbi:uncharacterized protein B0I36DRAFT_324791 [Microdochium trichocladiopsis]|uniref:Uncharacterized protein n=1 Tax=Microdochium trichocladiopsis TaxID=1682393 RepID=A0A9P8Y3E8_9PEZI|nr:uncharacterized protein B0I36DRAFT_324791 [Microdochium trichocladiopsis]KAH7028966.1 hypothetical protein B0I36DRAFT_324791 [Microdochium trichocladiopsis]
MASICDYVPPEWFDMTGRERQGVGTTFPYFPDLYNGASDYYGPGTLLAWFLLLASFTLTSLFWPITVQGRSKVRQPRITADLMALLFYVIFAATDLLIQTVGILGLQGRAKALLCLRYPHFKIWQSGLPQLDRDDSDGDTSPLPSLGDMSPELVEYGQRIVALTGPLAVCCLFVAVAFVWYHIWDQQCRTTTSTRQSPGGTTVVKWEPNMWLMRLVVGVIGYVLIVLSVHYINLGADGFGESCILAILEFVWPFYFTLNCLFPLLLLVSCSTLAWGAYSCAIAAMALLSPNTSSNTIVQPARAWGFALFVGPGMTIVAVSGIYTGVTMTNATLLTDLGKPLAERGQLGSLLAGIATTTFSVYEAFIRRCLG